jgi:hypothetical protein
LGTRTNPEQLEHDKLVAAIATERFSYSDRTTYTNPNGEKNYAVNGEYPDIVAVKSGDNPIMGEVETESSVNEEESDQWKSYAALPGYIYLYVPKSKASDARTIINSESIGITGLRSYEYVNGKLVITNV